MSETEKKWRKTGLLYGTEGIDAELLADNLNQCAQYLINEGTITDKTPYMYFKAETLLPIVVRLFQAGIRILNIGLLYNSYTEFMNKNSVWKDLAVMENGEIDFIEMYIKYINTDERVDAFFL